RVLLGVEEVGRLQMGREVVVFDVDARDLRRTFERRALAFDGQLGSDLVEFPLEPAGEVGNLEVDSRVNGVEVPGTGGNIQNRRAHRLAPFVLRGYTCNCKYPTGLVVAYASIRDIGHSRSSRPRRGRRAAKRGRTGRLGRVPAGTRHPHAPARG